jgi:hypothetical protein
MAGKGSNVSSGKSDQREGLLTVGKLREENVVSDTLQDDTALAVELVDRWLPGEAVDDDETCCKNTKDHHGFPVRAPYSQSS